MITYLAFGVTYAFVAAVQPGPLQTYLISQTVKKGWRATLPASLAPVISDVPILLLVLFLLSTIPGQFIVVLRIGGGGFLLYLSWQAFKSWRDFDSAQCYDNESGQKTLAGAVVVNLLNPAPYLGWSLIMGPMFIQGWVASPIYGIALIIGFYMTMVLTLAGTIVLFGLARKLGPRVSRHLIGLSCIVLFGFGLYQLWMGLTG